MRFDPAKPYNELPDLPPQGEIETRSVLKASIRARDALARLNAEIQTLPTADVLIGPAMLQEARDSSAIENIVTTDDALFRGAQLAEAPQDPAEKEAHRYRQALYDAIATLKTVPIGTRLAVQICRTVTGRELDIRVLPGTTLMNQTTGETIYTPPLGAALIRDKLANWERFVHDDGDLDALVRMAIQHYHFEAIHPFADGNGRTGRILNVLYLIDKKLLDRPIIYLSREILNSRETYYRRLIEVTRQDAWSDWIEYFLGTVERSALSSETMALQTKQLIEHTSDYLRAKAPKSAANELAGMLFSQPYLRIADVVDRGIAKRQTASEYLHELVQLGILEDLKVGREKLFVHRKFLQLLTSESAAIDAYLIDADRAQKKLFPLN